MFCSRGCAILYARNGLQDSIVPLVASHSHYSTFRERFYQQATRDMISFCVVPTAIDYFEKIGGMVSCLTSTIMLFIQTVFSTIDYYYRV